MDGNSVFGWFDKPDSVPTYDPPHDAPCLFCDDPVHPLDVVTTSLYRPGEARAYFYRTHSSCLRNATVAERIRVDGLVWDMIDNRGS